MYLYRRDIYAKISITLIGDYHHTPIFCYGKIATGNTSLCIQEFFPQVLPG